MAFTEDFSEFLDADNGFAANCVYKGRAISGIFGKDYIEVDMIQGSAPMLLIADDDIADIAQADPILVDGVAYTVREYHPDGTGMTRLILEST